MTLSDEFEFLMGDSDTVEKETDQSKTKDNIDKYREFVKEAESNNLLTYQGIISKNVADCMTIETNEILTDEHVVFTFDMCKLRDITDRPVKQFKVPEFVEEIRGDIKDNNIAEFSSRQLVCNRLQIVIIPSSVKLINSMTFLSSRNLERVIVNGEKPEDIESEEWFETGFSDKESQLMFIGNQVFDGCDKLSVVDVRYSHNLSVVGKNLLSACALTNFKISDKIIVEDKLELLADIRQSLNNKKKLTVDKKTYTPDELDNVIEEIKSNSNQTYDF
jgi:hypothetical protein